MYVSCPDQYISCRGLTSHMDEVVNTRDLPDGIWQCDERPDRLTHVVKDIEELQERRRFFKLRSETVALVPTMGALHQGHLSLIQQAARETDQVFVSIFVNPSQFGANEDLDSYPRDLLADVEMLNDLNDKFSAERADGRRMGRIGICFAPTAATMYPRPEANHRDLVDAGLKMRSDKAMLWNISLDPVTSLWEGRSRPAFFPGVVEICVKLFNIVQPERVYFGQKDIQQAVVIQRLIKDFFFDTTLRLGPTVRDSDGLALSSRNVYLGTRRRRVAIVLYEALQMAKKQVLDGERLWSGILLPALKTLRDARLEQLNEKRHLRALFEVDYFSMMDPRTMIEVDNYEAGKRIIIAGAIKMLPLEEPRPDEDCGRADAQTPVRLIDNIIIPALDPENVEDGI